MAGPTNGGRARGYEALHESEELHRATLSNISDAVFLTDDDGAFTFICPNVDVIFGYVPDEVQAMGADRPAARRGPVRSARSSRPGARSGTSSARSSRSRASGAPC